MKYIMSVAGNATSPRGTQEHDVNAAGSMAFQARSHLAGEGIFSVSLCAWADHGIGGVRDCFSERTPAGQFSRPLDGPMTHGWEARKRAATKRDTPACEATNRPPRDSELQSIRSE